MKISKFDYFLIIAVIGIISILYLFGYKLQLVNSNEISTEEFDGMVLFQSKFSVDDTFDNISCEAVPNKKKALVEIMEYVKKCGFLGCTNQTSAIFHLVILHVHSRFLHQH